MLASASVRGGVSSARRCARASDAMSRLLTTQWTCLSDERGVVVSVPRLSLRQTQDSATTDASDAGNSTVGEVAHRDTWPLCGATDATDVSIAPKKMPNELLTALFEGVRLYICVGQLLAPTLRHLTYL
jgi:hypothetical protein